ncbi:MAG: cytidine deaminase [Ginsengibacter sp.]
MKTIHHTTSLQLYDSIDELNEADAFLLSEARSATQFAYAPYSNFLVAAVGKLQNGEVVIGTNQENASYPAGFCAERSMLATASSVHPGIAVSTIAITYNNLKGSSNKPASPCGICRQSLAEHSHRFNLPIRLILSGMEGQVQVIENCLDLLPLRFGADDLA